MAYSIEPITLSELALAIGGELVFGCGDTVISAVSTDSRDCDGAVFVAISGEKFNGNDFIPSACEGGAIGYISDRTCTFDKCDFAIKVKSTTDALLNMASAYRDKFDIKIIGLTGSVGKTTTKDMVAAALSGGERKVLKTQGNFNNNIGVPYTLFGIRGSHDIGVVEMGMNHFGEISALTACAKPDIAIITNIGESHIEYLGSREGILKAKCEIFEGLSPNGIVILNGDDDLLYSIRDNIPFETIYCGIENASCDVVAGDIKSGNEGISFTALGENYHINTVGRHNVLNALLAIAAGRALGISADEIREGLASYKSGGIRQSITERDGITVITDCYNAAPISVRAAIDVLCEKAQGRKIAVLGDMKELGEKSGEYHYEMGEYAFLRGVDELLLIGEFASYTADGGKGCNPQIFDTNADITAYLKTILKEGDTILFKGSRAMKLEEVANQFN